MKIYPFRQVGLLKLGMTKCEVDILFHAQGSRNPIPNCDEGYFYIDNSGKQQHEYGCGFVNNRLCRIMYILHKDDAEKIDLFNVDLAHTPAETVISELEKRALCTWDTEDKDLSYFYTFPSIGIMLFRPSAFHPKLLKTDYFADWDPEAAKDERKYEYFEAVILATDPKYF